MTAVRHPSDEGQTRKIIELERRLQDTERAYVTIPQRIADLTAIVASLGSVQQQAVASGVTYCGTTVAPGTAVAGCSVTVAQAGVYRIDADYNFNKFPYNVKSCYFTLTKNGTEIDSAGRLRVGHDEAGPVSGAWEYVPVHRCLLGVSLVVGDVIAMAFFADTTVSAFQQVCSAGSSIRLQRTGS